MRKSIVEATVLVLAIASLLCVLCVWWFGGNMAQLKDVWQVVFWLAATAVALLTYIIARTGLLQPIRTEVFKLQLSELQDLQSLFVAKEEIGLREQFDLTNLVARNARLLLGDYCKIVLGVLYEPSLKLIDISDGWRPLNTPLLSTLQRDPWLDSSFKTFDERVAFWKDYTLSGIVFPRTYLAGVQRLRSCLAHPLLPAGVRTLIESYVKRVGDFEPLLVAALNECGKQLPTRYPTRESLDIVQGGENAEVWIFNEFNRAISEKPTLRDLSRGIVDSIRTYLRIENLVNP